VGRICAQAHEAARYFLRPLSRNELISIQSRDIAAHSVADQANGGLRTVVHEQVIKIRQVIRKPVSRCIS
jgi:hypothetical protein